MQFDYGEIDMMDKVKNILSTGNEKASELGGKVVEKGKQVMDSEVVSKTTDMTKKGALVLAKGVSSGAKGLAVGVKTISNKAVVGAKNAQAATLHYIDKKKNARFLEAKLKSFEDGMKEGKIETVDYIKKYANFCLAATAVSFFFARCDGEIVEEELLEIQFDLDAIIKNKDLPEELRNTLAAISLNENISFKEVKKYLDGVSTETVLEFQKDVDEIIFADGVVSDGEKKAKKQFDDYLASRLETTNE